MCSRVDVEMHWARHGAFDSGTTTDVADEYL